MVASLLEYETVDAEEVRAILEDRPYDRDAGLVAASEVSDADSGTHVPDDAKRPEKPSILPPTISPEPA